jgi:hypothetical protein
MKNELNKLVGYRFATCMELKHKIESIVGNEIAITDCPIETLTKHEDYRIFWENEQIGGTIWYIYTRENYIYITEMCFDD